MPRVRQSLISSARGGFGDVVCRKKAPNIEKVVARTATEGETGMIWMVEEDFEVSA